jgi:hypothetical protein
VKSQTDLIISIVAIVVALIAAGIFYGTKPKPEPAGQVAPVNVKTAELPAGDVKMASSLASGGPGGGPSGGPGGPMGGALGGRGGAGLGLSNK